MTLKTLADLKTFLVALSAKAAFTSMTTAQQQAVLTAVAIVYLLRSETLDGTGDV